MNISEVKEKFATLAGLSSVEADSWTSICEDSISEIESRLKDREFDEDEIKKLNSAAAALSFYKYVLCVSVKDDLNPANQYVSNPYTKNLALSLWRGYKSGISELLSDDNFEFKGII